MVAELIVARPCALPRPDAGARKRRLMIWAPRLLICQMHEPLIINNLRPEYYSPSTLMTTRFLRWPSHSP